MTVAVSTDEKDGLYMEDRVEDMVEPDEIQATEGKSASVASLQILVISSFADSFDSLGKAIRVFGDL